MKPSKENLPLLEPESGEGKAIRAYAPSLFFFWSRPLPGLTLAVAAGIVAGDLFPSAFPVAATLATATTLFLLLLVGRFERFSTLRHPVLPIACFCVLGVLINGLAAPILPAPASLEPYFDRPQTLFLAEVTSPAEIYPDKIRLPLSIQSALAEGRTFPVEGGVLLTMTRNEPPGKRWLTGDKLMLRLTLKRFHNFNNPGGYDYVKIQAERGLHARAYVGDPRSLVRLVHEPAPFPLSVAKVVKSDLDRFRQDALDWLQRSLQPDTAALYAALLLGYRNLIPKTLQEHINRAGVMHLLAISGLHLGLVSMMSFWLACRIIRLSWPSLLQRTSDRQLALWVAILAAAAYALISGMAVPTWRSLIMLILIFGAGYWCHSTDRLSALAAAALVILLISPYNLRQVSFQLSFAAVLGLMLLYPRLQKLRTMTSKGRLENHLWLNRSLGPFMDAFWVSLAANVAVLPLIVTHFHGFSVAGIVANTFLVPVVGLLVLPLGLISLLVFAVNEHLALVVLKVGALLLSLCRDAIVWFSQLSWAFFWVGTVPVAWLVFFYAGLALLLSSWRPRWKAACIVAGFLSLLTVFSVENAVMSRDPAVLKVTFLDVGQGTSTLVQFPSGENMLVDGGGFHDDSFDVGRAVVAPFLWASGIRRLDRVVLSHDHPDHRNGLRFILSHFPVKSYWESGVTEHPGEVNELTAIASRRGIPVRKLPNIVGNETIIAGCRLRVLHPLPSYVARRWDGNELNNVSLVLQIDYENTGVILPGDVDQSVENLLFENHVSPGSLIVLSPHHGSAYSNGKLLFDRLRPGFMVFSCGYDNWFGFPAPGVLEECRKRKIACHRTDLQGAIQATSDGKQWKFQQKGIQ